MNVVRKTKKKLNLIHLTYAAVVFQDFCVLERVLHKSGSFIGMSYSKFMMFLRLEFNKAEDENFFNTGGMIRQGHIDIADYLGNRCFVFFRLENSKRIINPLLFIPDEEGKYIVSIKFSKKFTTEKNFLRCTKQFKGNDQKEFNLLFNN
jgi:hypothetical protein